MRGCPEPGHEPREEPRRSLGRSPGGAPGGAPEKPRGAPRSPGGAPEEPRRSPGGAPRSPAPPQGRAPTRPHCPAAGPGGTAAFFSPRVPQRRHQRAGRCALCVVWSLTLNMWFRRPKHRHLLTYSVQLRPQLHLSIRETIVTDNLPVPE